MPLRWSTVLCLAILAAGCADLRPARPREIFDERTGNTLSVVRRPLVFARERTDVAAHARDYATVVAIEVDRSGTYDSYLLLYRWSTVDRRVSPPPDRNAGLLRILADGRVLELSPLPELPVALANRSALLVPDHADVIARAYTIDPGTLHFLASSAQLALRMPQEALDQPFALWEDGRAALLEFTARPGPGP